MLGWKTFPISVDFSKRKPASPRALFAKLDKKTPTPRLAFFYDDCYPFYFSHTRNAKYITKATTIGMLKLRLDALWPVTLFNTKPPMPTTKIMAKSIFPRLLNFMRCLTFFVKRLLLPKSITKLKTNYKKQPNKKPGIKKSLVLLDCLAVQAASIWLTGRLTVLGK